MAALAEALQPAITNLEVSWHLPEGYDVIQTPQLLPFVQANERLVIYGILFRPPGEEKESPKAHQKRRMDWSMRSFSNSSVKVFWFEDECDLLSEDQLLSELDSETQRLSEDIFSEQDSFDAEMESFPEPDTIEAIADGLLRRICKESANDKPRESSLTAADPGNENFCEVDDEPFEKGDFIPDTQEINNDAENLQSIKTFNTSVLDDLSDDNTLGEVWRESKDVYEDGNLQEHQRSPKLARAHERDSGVGFSMEENDKSPDDSKTTLVDSPTELEEDRDKCEFTGESATFVESENTGNVAAQVHKNSEFLHQLGLPEDFGALNIRGYVGEEEVEQVIPFPVNRSGVSSQRPTIHQLLARSLIREMQAALDPECSETIDMIKRISDLSNMHCRYTARVARDQYCYDDQVLSALQFPQKENRYSIRLVAVVTW